MFLYKGGHAVKRGTYWDPETREKVVLKVDGTLPGTSKETYFKLPESYLLIPLFLLGLGLSMAFPYGVGFVAFIVLIALSGALYAAGFRIGQDLQGNVRQNRCIRLCADNGIYGRQENQEVVEGNGLGRG